MTGDKRKYADYLARRSKRIADTENKYKPVNKINIVGIKSEIAESDYKRYLEGLRRSKSVTMRKTLAKSKIQRLLDKYKHEIDYP